jgi:hypothetical protein
MFPLLVFKTVAIRQRYSVGSLPRHSKQFLGYTTCFCGRGQSFVNWERTQCIVKAPFVG